MSERVDGLLLATTRLSDAAIRMAAKLRPLVVLNRAVADVPSVLADDPHGMWCALQHLGQLGHDGVTYVAGPEASFADGTRWRAARDLAARLGLRVRRIGPFSPDVDGGRDAAAELLARPSSAVVTFNDLMALGLLATLQGAGVRVPADVSVVGFDNVFGTEFSAPALTTVAAPVRAMDAVGARRLLAEICGSPRPAAGPTVLPVRLAVRASTAQRSRKSTSPACGTTRVSGSLAQAFGLTSAGSR